MNRILELLSENARLTNAQLAVLANMTENQVEKEIEALEKSGVIKGYKALVDLEKTGDDKVSALIELKVTPKRDFGFEEIAKTISEFDEVESVYLMSGGYDLAVMVTGKTFKEVSLFVSHRLAPLDSILSTATHFVLRCYKIQHTSMFDGREDDRGQIIL